MYIHEYGTSGAPIILGLHPMSITGAELYETLAKYLKGDYCVITPDEGGHGLSGPYISLEDEVSTLKDYLLGKGYTHIRLLYGASMGVTPAYELLKEPEFTFDKIWFDGAGFSDKAPHGMWLIRPVIRVVLKIYKRFPKHITDSFVKNYGPVFGGMMKQNFEKLGVEDFVRIFTAMSDQKLVTLPNEVQENMHFEWGENDSLRKSAGPVVEKYFPSAKTFIRKGYAHCTYMAFNTGEYVKELEEFI